MLSRRSVPASRFETTRMDKKDVARLLDQIAAFLELKGDNQFRIRAYHTAARAISTFPGGS